MDTDIGLLYETTYHENYKEYCQKYISDGLIVGGILVICETRYII